MGLQRTYKELKLLLREVVDMRKWQCLQRTYKELKPRSAPDQRFLKLSLQRTYKELKLLALKRAITSRARFTTYL